MVESKIALANAACTCVAGLATLFFIVGAAGFSSSERDLRNVPWFYTTDLGTISFGLRSFSFNSGGPPVIVDYSDSSECNQGYCDKCDKDGQAAAALTILALFIAITVTAISAAQTVWYNRRILTVAAGLSALSVIFVVIALGLMLGDCYNRVTSSTQLDEFSFEWGAGSALTLVGAILMALATLFLTIAVLLGADPVKPRKSSIDEASSTMATVGAHDNAMYAHPHPPEYAPIEDPAEESMMDPTGDLEVGLKDSPTVPAAGLPGAPAAGLPLPGAPAAGLPVAGMPAEAVAGVPTVRPIEVPAAEHTAGTPAGESKYDPEQDIISPRSGKFRACSISLKE